MESVSPETDFEILLSLPGMHVWGTLDGERAATTEDIMKGAAKHIDIPDAFSGNVEDQDTWIRESLADSFSPAFHFHSLGNVSELDGERGVPLFYDRMLLSLNMDQDQSGIEKEVADFGDVTSLSIIFRADKRELRQSGQGKPKDPSPAK